MNLVRQTWLGSGTSETRGHIVRKVYYEAYGQDTFPVKFAANRAFKESQVRQQNCPEQPGKGDDIDTFNVGQTLSIWSRRSKYRYRYQRQKLSRNRTRRYPGPSVLPPERQDLQ